MRVARARGRSSRYSVSRSMAPPGSLNRRAADGASRD
jgi:hypothetical protein